MCVRVRATLTAQCVFRRRRTCPKCVVSVASGYVYRRLGVTVHAPARRMRSKGRRACARARYLFGMRVGVYMHACFTESPCRRVLCFCFLFSFLMECEGEKKKGQTECGYMPASGTKPSEPR